MNKNILVFGATRARANFELEQMVEKMNPKDINKIRKSSNEFLVVLNDGTIYRTVCASDSARGCKCQKAYIDNMIDSDILCNVIIPCLCVSNLPVEERIVYFD